MTFWPPASLGEILQMLELAILAAGLRLGGRAYASWRGLLLAQSVRQNQAVFVRVGDFPREDYEPQD